jgi:hypothetical protein
MMGLTFAPNLHVTCHLTLGLKYSFLMNLHSFYIIIWFKGTLALDRGEEGGLDMMPHLR